MIRKEDIAGTVVIYNSSFEVLYNINTYIDQISKLYIVDNSTEPNELLLKKFTQLEKFEYISLKGNKGIAKALNTAAQQALADGYSVLLTMDDDTQTPSEMVNQMINFWNTYTHPIGILSGVHHTKPDNAPFRALPYTLTSGNLLNLRAYIDVGSFRDDLFIDHVDHEYGLRLNNKGYHVVEIPSLRLTHRLGYNTSIKLGSYVIKSYGSHSPIRLYYFARNGVYLAKDYFKSQPVFVWSIINELIKRWIKALLFQDNRMERVRMLLKGTRDGWKGKLGKYE